MSRSFSTPVGHWLPALALIVVAGATPAAQHLDLRRQAPVRGDAAAGAAKSEVCVACHGPNGNSIVPMFPRLAGQRIDYLYWRLVAYKNDDPNSSPMPGLVQTLTDADMRNLAAYFAAQAPAAAPDASAGAAGAPGTAESAQNRTTSQSTAASAGARGQDLYLHGDPARGIPPCQGCHGQDATGPTMRTGPYATYPVLRGQHSVYVVTRLTQFRDRVPQPTTNDFIMHGVARTLDDQSIQAIAGWIEALPLAPVQ